MSASGIRPGRRGRSVVTGLGVVAPTGIGAARHWESVLAGKSGLGRITRFDPTGYPVRVAGEVPGFRAGEQVPGRLVPQTDRFTHFALAAAEDALADAAADPATLPEYEMAVVTASSSGGTEFGQHEMENLYQKGSSWVGAYQSIAWFYAATTGQVSIRHGMRGPCGVICGEQAGGLDALGQSRRLLDTGSRLVLSGGTDASLCPYGLVAQMSTGRLSTEDDPARAYLPFDAAASGFVPGEGGAVLVVEQADAARARGVPAYGELRGYAAGFDPTADGTAARHSVLVSVVRRALADAGLAPGDIDMVFADASGTLAEDLAEARAITEVFGPGGVPVTAPKTLTGRLYAGGAALDVATALLALSAGVVPHTAGLGRTAPGCEIDLVLDRPRQTDPRTALVLARGHGGFTSALVLGAGDRDARTK
ncbi:ketosynthase chain-length factor [Streptomyces poonensis]|uniref:Actinorhodin polyketide putative beta-ketoacyl synthase 2 n=1 Tax=Streptomyces poonensis TaxID=68255 RepID=A0A918PJ98_9ACTN|nr:ketosynthase chain-length factor [Streptomyces poonensis]GGZ10954.1 actinorhodin polyketide putative beta-ketoacyl synthase 2 [Streptomyces poonensis]GLJ91646.1 actinorhodin polyketide putative beta-ketoacyl synthase 2 [Streptomyces poonensis]